MNYYNACIILNLPNVFTDKELKQNYYMKALQYHPDKNMNLDITKKFQEVLDAYNYLNKCCIEKNDMFANENFDDNTNKNEKSLQSYNSSKQYNIIESYKVICDSIIDKIINIKELKYINLRETLYDICIFDLNILNCIWYILKVLTNKKFLNGNKLNRILIETYNFLKLYNNNYRPIYHLERYILYISASIYELL